jgi:hypothetical protein
MKLSPSPRDVTLFSHAAPNFSSALALSATTNFTNTTNTPHTHTTLAATMSSLFKAVTTPSAEKADKPAPKSRVLVLSSRGVTYRHRHLLNDLVAMLPHSRKDAKLDTKSHLHYLNEVAELYNCNGVLFFEARKRQDLYMWLSRNPNGPCVKFHIQNREYIFFPGEVGKRMGLTGAWDSAHNE